jgi:5-methylcytosine-specific restriction endonuclease McrA
MSSHQISLATRRRVRQVAADRCGYCLSPQALILGRLEIDHIIPSARGGTDSEENLWLACSLCNNYKGSQIEARDPLTGEVVALFNHAGSDGSITFNGMKTEHLSRASYLSVVLQLQPFN